jgi:hypothetical protein
LENLTVIDVCPCRLKTIEMDVGNPFFSLSENFQVNSTMENG